MTYAFADTSRFSFFRWVSLVCLIVVLLSGHAFANRFSTVVIDAGHGGSDKGSLWGGVRESRLNLAVAKELQTLLKKRGIRTVMTRTSDTYISLPRRAQIGNAQRNAVFVSIHFNASRVTSVRGVETYYWGSSGKILANAIQRRLAPRLSTKNRGIQKKGYHVIIDSRHTSVLVECGFISNARERSRASTSSYQKTAAKAIYDGLMAWRAL
ncbi:N-acetylmuramoyl-L-alanine amidase [Luteolibacter pohnpeiensis]|uniref:N-acetylmuramoyl-L-alanine amidase n=1 Tax=Luteolibacter pohnpeiensis TaxID=454153 RepID=A0A934VVV0_9BACT|nr:N-acetylmuramoyl-L-alanine amidase [Luteolibacter pohnpeiensis]MBK1883957.1 N-acetylmuramoyl-L-alanine amidase [Luteolibacter pohnpeiensis]